ncbi:MAG: PEFG-CTERM sorting domain-containing protein [Nitrosopumilaceae archaeon]|nr:PEFG-CTERM sorting domain-containing protein [Nitrosopumilaceae archaeon]NIT99904.1 PEFG-CTERM sorting domain-containing protein [Nitrosopumilaceae archaeon]NIU86258.1 PEFG-CTERM sorting domain-containing protein [Nitrosopumilaceae archaeon]NIV65013.1 PEFG-CTERM sorting domain-containing protein [Nitrosopumilaceae archaeon]NIX60507.1 PEFG-CTERM sorting domain-containing protein [Nitrosopumilaceae archaeon]
MRITTIGSFVVLIAVVTGLGISTPSTFADHATAEVSIPAGTSTPGCEKTDECYIPAEVTVDVGGEVTWTNDDSTSHTVTSGTPGSPSEEVGSDFDSSIFMGGETFSHKFEEAGTFDYFCMIHPWMQGKVIVEAEGSEGGEEELMVDITTSSTGKGERMSIDVTFMDMSGMDTEHVNYDIKATQGGKVVLDEKGVHDHDGKMSHMSAPLPNAASDANPVDVEVKFLGFGLPDEEWTGPVGHVATKKVVPEFGTIAVMILGVAIISIIAISAKNKIVPRI